MPVLSSERRILRPSLHSHLTAGYAAASVTSQLVALLFAFELATEEGKYVLRVIKSAARSAIFTCANGWVLVALAACSTGASPSITSVKAEENQPGSSSAEDTLLDEKGPRPTILFDGEDVLGGLTFKSTLSGCDERGGHMDDVLRGDAIAESVEWAGITTDSSIPLGVMIKPSGKWATLQLPDGSFYGGPAAISPIKDSWFEASAEVAKQSETKSHRLEIRIKCETYS